MVQLSTYTVQCTPTLNATIMHIVTDRQMDRQTTVSCEQPIVLGYEKKENEKGRKQGRKERKKEGIISHKLLYFM